jgi:CBS domain-containing protein
MTIDKVSDHLSKHHLPGAPVVNKSGELIGYISEYDCLQQLMQSSYYCDNASLVEDVMSTKLIMSRPDIALIDLASTMNASKVNVMPIVEAGKLVGAVSRGDIMRALVKDMDTLPVPV